MGESRSGSALGSSPRGGGSIPPSPACDLYRNPYQTRCHGSISPHDAGEATISVCWRHLAAEYDARIAELAFVRAQLATMTRDRDLWRERWRAGQLESWHTLRSDAARAARAVPLVPRPNPALEHER